MEVTTNEGMHTTSLSVLPDLLLKESCARGEQKGRKHSHGALTSPSHSSPSPLFIKALFKHTAAADVPERTFGFPPASQLKHLGSDMTSSGGYFLFSFFKLSFYLVCIQG